MTSRASLPLIALACALAGSVPSHATAADSTVGAGQTAALKNRRKLRKLLRRKGLAKLPSVAGALAARTGKHRRGTAAVVTGTPPALVSIPDASVKDLFWRPGVVDAIAGGTASPEQCSEFWSGGTDGQSGGMGACHMAEGVGYSLGDILGGDTSLCYMKRFPTRANLSAGALSLLDGAFPGDDPSRLFSVPGGSTSRVVKVSVSGEKEGAHDVFLRVHGEDENQAAGDLYAVDLWYCGGAPQPKGFDHIRITDAGEFTAEQQEGHEDGAYVATISGFVTFTNGQVVYDTTRSRRAQVASSHPGGSFKADHQIAGDNTIASKSYDVFDGGTHMSYVIASFSGSDVDTLRFLAGAFKERNSNGGGPSQPDFVGSTEYRDGYYAASPGSALESGLETVAFDSDPFYAAPPSIAVDASAYSCATVPDVAVAIDFANPAGAAVKARCETRVYDRMHFCHEDPTVHSAEQNVGPVCYGPH